MRRIRCLLTVLSIFVATTSLQAASLMETPPPGPHFKLEPQDHEGAPSFRSGAPIVGTSYFYWYDVYSGRHIVDHDGTDAMTTHPPQAAMADLSYKSPAWHYAQLNDVREAGIDFILPVYWGVPAGGAQQWSIDGLGPLVQAHDRMLAEHEANPTRPMPPAIGLFYDTTTLRSNVHPDGRRNVPIDLTTPYGREWFYVSMRDFFSMIPPAKWARIDGKPIVFLYSAHFAEAIDAKLFDDTRKRFIADFGTDLFLVRHADWPGRADAWYQWGGALGIKLGDVTAALGPGYDHSAVPGRKPLVVPRDSGRFYQEQWVRLLGMRPERRPWIVHVETWNEWHEGTDVARGRKWGTLYMQLTRRYADLFRKGVQLARQGPFVNAERVRWSGEVTGGLTLRPSAGDGTWAYREIDGQRAVVTTAKNDTPGRYLYFNVDDSYLFDEQGRVAEITIVFRDDGGCAKFRVEYDNNDSEAGPVMGAFRPTRWIEVGNSKSWRTVSLQLPDIRFSNRANNADFRFAVQGKERRLTVREVIVRRLAGQVVTTQPARS